MKNKSDFIGVNVTPELCLRVKETAARAGISTSLLCRLAIEAWLQAGSNAVLEINKAGARNANVAEGTTGIPSRKTFTGPNAVELQIMDEDERMRAHAAQQAEKAKR